MKRIIITGSSGFIGTSLAMYLENKYELILVDKSPQKTKLENSIFIFLDINEITSSMIQGCIGIIHLAAISRVVWGEEKPMSTWTVNVEGTQHILNIAQSLENKPWIIYGSSREIYGESNDSPVKEDNQWKPINRYGISKLAAEGLVHLYGMNNNVATISLRFSNVYGNTYDQLDRVIPKFILQTLNNETIELQGSSNSFDFTHIDDTIEAISLTINYLEKIKYTQKDCYPIALNICTGQETRLDELSSIITELTLSSSDIIETERRKYDVNNFRGNWKLANSLIKYSPRINLKEGLANLIKLLKTHFQEVYS